MNFLIQILKIITISMQYPTTIYILVTGWRQRRRRRRRKKRRQRRK